MVTDYGEGDRTDFILSPRAYTKLARPNSALELFAYGVVDVEYRSISCQFDGYNLMYKVGERSKYRRYLAIVILYVAGQNDITAVELWQVIFYYIVEFSIQFAQNVQWVLMSLMLV